MNPSELTKQVDELRNELSKMRADFDAYKKNADGGLASVMNSQQTHTHGGTDSSTMIYNDSIHLKPGQQFATGNFSIAENTGSPQPGQDSVMRGFLIMGDDLNATDGIQNAQITFEHQPTTDGGTNQTFLYAFRSPLYIGGDGAVTSAGSTLETGQYDFPTDSLIGAYAQVTNPADGTFESYLITANTNNTITIDGAWGFTAIGAFYVIFVSVYLGSADFPWRRVYVTEGTGGGIRIGNGDTNGGQNALIYLDSATGSGGLSFRNMAGVSTSIYVGSGAPSHVATKGSLYIRTDGSSTSTRMYINTNGSTAWTNFTTAA